MQKRTLRYSMLMMLVIILTLSMVAPAAAKVGRTIDVQILAINDFHGALEENKVDFDNSTTPPTPIRAYGGAAYLATYIKQAAAKNPNTIFVGDGDLIGASPLLSSLFHDEPTVLALSQMGMQLSSVGNHEFDEGVQELLRIQYGGCNPIDGCLAGPYPGAGYEYLAANVIVDKTGKTLFPPYAIKNYNGARVGFIGVDYQDTPSIVTAAGTEGVTFKPELDTINKYAKQLKQMRVKTIVVLLHDGFNGQSDCENTASPLNQMIQNVDPAVDVVITGHSHQYYICTIGDKLVTSAWYNGRMFTDINLTIDKATGDVTQKSAVNVLTTHDVTPDQGIVDLLAKYKAIADPIANAPVGYISADITRAANISNGESALGDVIADGQLLNTAPEGAVIAMTNPGGIRADLTYASSLVGEGDGVVTYGEAFSVQPFSNYMVIMDLTGAQLKDVLEQQQFTSRMLQISNGFTFSFSQSAPTGSKISDMALNGVPIDMNATYRVAVNNFLAGGGDGFTGFTVGTNQVIGAFDIDAFVAYLKTSTQSSPIQPGPQNRITALP